MLLKARLVQSRAFFVFCTYSEPVKHPAMPIKVGLFTLLLFLIGCDHGLAPPPTPPYGVIQGTVFYRGDWPPPDSLYDIRFIAFRFIPEDTTDFFRLNEMVISHRLRTHVTTDTFSLQQVAPGTFPYAGVAYKWGAGLLDWRPVGQVEAPFTVHAGETTKVTVYANFDHPPPFPPRSPD